MRSLLIACALLVSVSGQALAQPPQTIKLAVDTKSQERGGGRTARLLADIRRGLEGLADVELVPAGQSRRTIWLVADMTGGVFAASMMVTERYDRETLMVLGIEDDDMAERMMALQIANDHQIFTGSDPAELAKRIVAAVDAGVLARVRPRPPKP